VFKSRPLCDNCKLECSIEGDGWYMVLSDPATTKITVQLMSPEFAYEGRAACGVECLMKVVARVAIELNPNLFGRLVVKKPVVPKD
jgi:hypothetical protein